MKTKRQKILLELIRENVVETQDELSGLLRGSGYETTQATISRDIKELGLTKVPASGGRYRYSAHRDGGAGSDRLGAIFRDSVISVDAAQNIVVVKTEPALASAACSALDSMPELNIVGTLAGDDTAFILMRNAAEADKLHARFRAMMDR